MNFVLALPGALFVGFSLGMFGSGGSILTVPILVYVLGQDEKVAIAGSLAIVGLVALFGSAPYVRDRLVSWRTVLTFGVPGIIGTYFGAWSAAFVSGTVQMITFAVVMLLASGLMLRPPAISEKAGKPRALHKITLDGLAVGALTGFVGVGGGFLIVPTLVLLGGLTMHQAAATSLVIIALKSLAGFTKYLDILETQNLELNVPVIATFAVAGIVGSLGGNALACRLPQEKLRIGFGYFLIVMAAFILFHSLTH